MADYINGSDLLVMVGDYCVGHCTSHEVSYTNETTTRNVKPVVTKSASSGTWVNKGIKSKSISVSLEGLQFYEETEHGKAYFLSVFAANNSAYLKIFERGKESSPYVAGDFVLTEYKESAPANDDATYSATFENDGEPEVLETSNVASSTTEETEGAE